MKLKINPELLAKPIENAQRDHPRVRRIGQDTYGVRCTKKCVLGQEHQIVFSEEEDGLYAECIGCASQQWGKKVCRHIAACLPLFFFYREQEAA